MVVYLCDCGGKEIARFEGFAKGKRFKEQGRHLSGLGEALGGRMGRHLVCGVCYEACEAVLEGMKENKIVKL